MKDPKTGVSRRRYADILREVLDQKQLSIRALSRVTSFSYEHCRKIVHGDPVASEATNRAICEAVGLPVEEMWQKSLQEKLRRKAQSYHIPAVPPADPRMAQAWSRLTPSQRANLTELAEALAEKNERVATDLETRNDADRLRLCTRSMISNVRTSGEICL